MPHHFLEVALSKIFKKCKETEKSKKRFAILHSVKRFHYRLK